MNTKPQSALGRPCAWVIGLTLLLASQTPAFAAEPNWLKNLRWTLDTSSRRVQPTDGSPGSWQHVVGLDLHTVFSNGRRDVATLVFQPYVVGLNNVAQAPFFFDDGDDVELTWRIANVNFTGLSNGGFNIRVGHFEVPFGLEQNLDTNGTLQQFTFADRGIKTDWGVTINGVLPRLEYEVAVSRGSGVDYRSRFDPHLLSGRIGTLSNRNLVLGASFLTGEVLTANGTVSQRRLGVDLEYYTGPWEWMLELSGGTREGQDQAMAMLQSQWASPLRTWTVYGQLRESYRDVPAQASRQTQLTLGLDYQPSPRWAFGLQANHLPRSFQTAASDTQLTAQIRWRL